MIKIIVPFPVKKFTFAFRKISRPVSSWQYGIVTLVALFHDVLITLGVFSILYGMIPGLNLEISISIVAAFLTLVGYSINDTVVVFDRVREDIKIIITTYRFLKGPVCRLNSSE